MSVHAAISQRFGGPAGLIAGCGFAVHILKAYLDFDPSQWRATIRTYVDDIALSYVGTSAQDVARVLAKELPLLKTSLISRHMVSNDAKEQLYSPTAGILNLWKHTNRSYAGTVSQSPGSLCCPTGFECCKPCPEETLM